MSTLNVRYTVKLVVIIMGLYLAMTSPSFSKVPQTHDVPIFHNDDGLGLLQDCTFMRAIASGAITEIPTTVTGRSTACLSSIKSVAQVIYSLQNSAAILRSCLPSADLDWLEVLEFVTAYMEKQLSEDLSSHSYGVWIMQALGAKYPCK